MLEIVNRQLRAEITYEQSLSTTNPDSSFLEPIQPKKRTVSDNNETIEPQLRLDFPVSTIADCCTPQIKSATLAIARHVHQNARFFSFTFTTSFVTVYLLDYTKSKPVGCQWFFRQEVDFIFRAR